MTPAEPPNNAPSSLYRSGFWKVGLRVVKCAPKSACQFFCCQLAGLYWLLAKHRREVVVENLLPALKNDRAAAKAKAKVLFREFALKLVDLWQYEAGLKIDELFGESTGWEHFTAARAQGRGILLLTPHLGNWEFGGPWLARQGVKLTVVTLAEPDEQFTKMRSASRARWNIETLVIRNDPFAFVEIIRRLEAGETVALLVDRPPPATAVEVSLFGRPFLASVAAAELARASGCVLLPVYLPRTGKSYSAHVLPAVAYDRAGLRDREARRRLTENILHAFEPVLCKHLEQWFHFVPIWPK